MTFGLKTGIIFKDGVTKVIANSFYMSEDSKDNSKRQPDEIKLIKQSQKGNAEAFAVLYDRHLKPIYRFILLKVNHRQEAEDICQRVFLKAWQHISGFIPKQPFSSWLYRIARNAVIDYWRTKKVVLTLSNPSLKESLKTEFALETTLDKELQIQKVWQALRQLNQDQQDVLLMRFVENLSHQEIAKIIGKTEGATKVIQHRAIKSLKKILENEKF